MIDWLVRIFNVLKNLKTGGVTQIFKVTGVQVGVDGAAYASGDVLGDKCPIRVELVRGEDGTGILQSIIAQDLSAQSGAFDVVIFDSNPTATTFTDNSALDVADADLPKIIGVVSITAANYSSFVDSVVATKTGIGLPIKSLSGNNPSGQLWIALVSRDTKTYVADELSLAFGILQD